MVYDLDGLEEYLLSLIKSYMNFGVIKSDSPLSFFEILLNDVDVLSSLNIDNTNQNQISSITYQTNLFTDNLNEKLLGENNSKIEQSFNKPIDNKRIIEALLKAYRITCFLIDKQIFEKKE